eukprot:2582579-Amphidinium_carterae.1
MAAWLPGLRSTTYFHHASQPMHRVALKPKVCFVLATSECIALGVPPPTHEFLSMAVGSH